MKFKYVIGKKVDPYYNLAMEECLMNCVDEENSIIFLWQNDKTIVVGRNQNVDVECDKESFLHWGGIIARRRSGGGAVYHDLGNINYSILSMSSNRDKLLYQDLMLALMEEYHITAFYNGRNDILVNGKKISGNAEYTVGSKVCQHGTILVHSDFAVMKSFLTPSLSKMERNHISSVESRVANLCDIIDNVSVPSIMEKVIYLTNATEIKETIDLEYLQRKIKFYSDITWVYGGGR
ncbi:lipoyl protein ligase domain-containing protein [uncultured Clostridium sp.]|uniref:lipoate--protein ligase family protein n=1 Tax=uncultured Clostridium sp. TaxID=59620 RepID=UPI002596B879|nr:hypothetical protein [uncultured Clostridium sp.]